jgi:hypothetical protein
VFCVTWGALYVSFTLSVSAVRNSLGLPEQPIYPFLTASSPLISAWIIGLLLVLVLFFTGAYQLNRCKRAPQGAVEDGRESAPKLQGDQGALQPSAGEV